jgi:hypothetical protein
MPFQFTVLQFECCVPLAGTDTVLVRLGDGDDVSACVNRGVVVDASGQPLLLDTMDVLLLCSHCHDDVRFECAFVAP